MKKIYSNNLISLQFAGLILLQPLIDMYRLFVGNAIKICGISLVEFFNIAFIGYLAVLFILNQRKLRSFTLALVYGVVLVAYLALHCYNIRHFNTSIITGTDISVFTELYVIVRTYVLPLMLLYMLIYTHTSKERLLHTVLALAWIISGVIVVTNLFKVAYIAYASGFPGNHQIQQNIIDWFTATAPADVRLLTSKGWFYSGNQIGLILFMLLPFSVYQALTRRKISDFILIAMQVVAMIMVSTKTATLGSILIIVCMMVLFIAFALFQKKLKGSWKPLLALMLIVIAGAGLIQFSPMKKQLTLQKLNDQQTDQGWEKTDTLLKENSNKQKNALDRNALIKQIVNSSYRCGIQEAYLTLLPVKDNVNFWVSVLRDPSKPQLNYRNFKTILYKEILRKNNNPKDVWLGIGYTTNFFYIERDIVSQNAWFGYLGTALLIGPYLILLLGSLVLILKNFKTRFTFYNCTLLISAFGSLGVSIVAGYLFGLPFSALIFTYIVGQLFQNARCPEKNDNSDQALLQ